jgi:polyisoprenoid-binding protein YceI
MAVVIAPPGEYVIDPARSRIVFTAKHQFGLGTVRGSFGLHSGEIAVTDPPTDSTVRAVADATSFASGSRARDKKVRSATFLHVEHHPHISFESTSAGLDSDGTWTLKGTLTARGVSAPVEFTVTDATTDNRQLTLAATATVDRYAHGITAMKGMAGRYLRLTAEIHATAPIPA